MSVTSEDIAKQFGFAGGHGAYAWRVVLNSPLDSERCRVMIATVAKPDVFVDQHKAIDPAGAAQVGNPGTLIEHAAPLPAIDEFFRQYGSELALACISQLNESFFLAWSANARPLFALMKECSFLPSFPDFVRSNAIGIKLYNAFIRGIIGKLMRDGTWVDKLGSDEELDEDLKYTFIGSTHVELDVVGGLLVGLPTLLSITSSLADVPFSPGNPKATQNTREQLKVNIDKLAQLRIDESRSALFKDGNGESTEFGDHIAYIHAALVQIDKTLRL